MSYKEDITINKNDLVNEWQNQASLYLKYAELAAEAIEERDNAKNHLEVVYSKLDYEIRTNWSVYLKSKPTEVSIKQWILRQKKYRKAQNILTKATKNVNMYQAARTALEHKKHALQNIVQLMVSGFYAEPKAPKSTREQELKRRKQREQQLNRKQEVNNGN